MKGDGSNKLQCWFNLSYASFATIPRVLMQEMPDEWQGKMADLLNEMDEAFPNFPVDGYTVRATDGNGKITKFPKWVLNYRHPDKYEVDCCRIDSI